MKCGNKDALQSGRDRYTAKNYITIWIFPLISFFFNFINGLFKKYIIINLSTMKYGQNNKILTMHETIFSSKFHGYMFIFFKSYLVLQKNKKWRDEKKMNKKKNKVVTQLLEAWVSLSISNESLVSFFN